MDLVFHLQDFDGPLDLLLHLIGSAKISIRDIFVSQVTDRYLQIIGDAGQVNMDEASEFIQMAATLLLIKSRALLPVPPAPPEEETPEELLIRQLEEYARFKEVAQEMQQLERAASRAFSKLPDEFLLPPPEITLEGVTLAQLIEAFAAVSARIPQEAEEEPEPGGMVVRERYTVLACMASILKMTRKNTLAFSSLLSEHPTREEVVTVFLALLELLKKHKMEVSQQGNEIILSRPGRKAAAHAL